MRRGAAARADFVQLQSIVNARSAKTLRNLESSKALTKFRTPLLGARMLANW
jgi:hypothetical protein